jgi:hypothetical protein
VKVKHDKAVLAECEKCGIVPRKKSLIAGLIELGVKEDAIGLLQLCNREVLQEILTKVRYGTPFLVKLIAYEHLLLNGRNEEAQELLKKIGKRKKINMFRKYHSELFGKKVCLNDPHRGHYTSQTSQPCCTILHPLQKRRLQKSSVSRM